MKGKMCKIFIIPEIVDLMKTVDCKKTFPVKRKAGLPLIFLKS